MSGNLKLSLFVTPVLIVWTYPGGLKITTLYFLKTNTVIIVKDIQIKKWSWRKKYPNRGYATECGTRTQSGTLTIPLPFHFKMNISNKIHLWTRKSTFNIGSGKIVPSPKKSTIFFTAWKSYLINFLQRSLLWSRQPQLI